MRIPIVMPVISRLIILRNKALSLTKVFLNGIWALVVLICDIATLKLLVTEIALLGSHLSI